jgi:hypothetical protein
MSSAATAVIIVVAIIVIALVIALTMAVRRRRLQQRFGPEYDRAIAEKDSRMHAEAELAERQRRVRSYHIQPLSAEARSRHQGEWQAIQEQFVDSPQTAVTEAYTLVTAVMRERGYPLGDDDQVADDLSVEHAGTVGHFRSAQAITREAAQGSVATEDLRQAFIHYRELFAELLGEPADVDPARDGAGRHTPADTEVAADQAPPAPAGPDADADADAVADADAEPMTYPDLEPDGSRRP